MTSPATGSRDAAADSQAVVHSAATWRDALALVDRGHVDCVAIDAADCEKALAALAKSTRTHVPVAVFAPEGLSKRAEAELKRLRGSPHGARGAVAGALSSTTRRC